MKAHFIQNDKSVSLEIEEIIIDSKLEEKLSKEFNKKTRVLEYLAGCTYYVEGISTRTLKSSSLDELWQMFKAYKTNQTIPERKCFFVARRIVT